MGNAVNACRRDGRNLEADVDACAEELHERGITAFPVPAELVRRAVAIFERAAEDFWHASELSYVEVEPLRAGASPLSFFIGEKSGSGVGKDPADEGEFRPNLVYATAADETTLETLASPAIAFLEPIAEAFFGCKAVTVGAQFTLGREMPITRIHRDYWSYKALSFMTPLYRYSAEEASLHYWPQSTDEQVDYEAQAWSSSAVDSCEADDSEQCTYEYQLGEGVLFHGNLQHQTKPFYAPKNGWGDRSGRVHFSIVIVAEDILEESADVFEHIQTVQSGHVIDPATGAFCVQ